MSDLGDLNFNANETEPNSFDVVPAGWYDVIITDTHKKPTQTGGHLIELKLQILNGSYQNRKLTDRLNLWNNNEKAVQIARGTLSSICRAVGVMTPKDSAELCNKPLQARVAIRKSDEYGEQNEVKGYRPRQAMPVPAPVQSPAPVNGTPATSSANPW